MLAWLLNSKEAFCQALAASAEFNRPQEAGQQAL